MMLPHFSILESGAFISLKREPNVVGDVQLPNYKITNGKMSYESLKSIITGAERNQLVL